MTDHKNRHLDLMPDEKLRNIRMVVCDLDGTLLYRPGKLSENAVKTIRSLRRKGILFGVCSGRPAYGLKNMLPVWKIENDTDFILGYNGGMIYEKETGKMESWMELSGKAIRDIMNTFDGYSVIFAEYEGNEMLADKKSFLCSRFAARNRLEFRKVSRKDLEHDTLKLMAIGMPWVLSRYERDMGFKNHVLKRKDCRMFRSGPFLIEIVSPELSKLQGVLKVAEEHGIRPDEILSFGNDNNDLEMIAGTAGCAVSDALPAIQEAALYTCGAHDRDGVAEFIRAHLLD